MNTAAPIENVHVPNQTLYVNNLNEKTSPDETKISLYFLFSQYGEILEIIIKKSNKMRGQAFVVFKDLISATNAMRDLQGFVLFGNPIRINYAKERSEIIAKIEGTYVPKKKSKNQEDAGPQKKVKGEKGERKPREGKQDPLTQKHTDVGEPNNILFIENLPEQCTEEVLHPLFKQFPGFKEVRLIAVKNVAFVEYGDELQAGIALTGLQGFQLTKDHALVISYAKQ